MFSGDYRLDHTRSSVLLGRRNILVEAEQVRGIVFPLQRRKAEILVGTVGSPNALFALVKSHRIGKCIPRYDVGMETGVFHFVRFSSFVFRCNALG